MLLGIQSGKNFFVGKGFHYIRHRGEFKSSYGDQKIVDSTQGWEAVPLSTVYLCMGSQNTEKPLSGVDKKAEKSRGKVVVRILSSFRFEIHIFQHFAIDYVFRFVPVEEVG